MTSAKRLEVGELLRLLAAVSKQGAASCDAARITADEQRLAAKYPIWAEVAAQVTFETWNVNRLIAEVCDKRGIPPEARPRGYWCWTTGSEP